MFRLRLCSRSSVFFFSAVPFPPHISSPFAVPFDYSFWLCPYFFSTPCTVQTSAEQPELSGKISCLVCEPVFSDIPTGQERWKLTARGLKLWEGRYTSVYATPDCAANSHLSTVLSNLSQPATSWKLSLTCVRGYRFSDIRAGVHILEIYIYIYIIGHVLLLDSAVPDGGRWIRQTDFEAHA